MSQAGSFLARKGARLVCLAEDGVVPVPLVTSARTAGGEVTLIADDDYAEPPRLRGRHGRAPADRRGAPRAPRRAVARSTSRCPARSPPRSSLYRTWVQGGGGRRAQAGGVLRPQRRLQGAARLRRRRPLQLDPQATTATCSSPTSVEDIWNKIAWLIDQGATAALSLVLRLPARAGPAARHCRRSSPSRVRRSRAAALGRQRGVALAPAAPARARPGISATSAS